MKHYIHLHDASQKKAQNFVGRSIFPDAYLPN